MPARKGTTLNKSAGIGGGGGTRFFWTVPPSRMGLEVERRYGDELQVRVYELMDGIAGEMQDYAQATAPWNDITGDARAGLVAEAVQNGTAPYIELRHSVDYGIWLEVRWGGTYAVIMPTMQDYYSVLMDAAQGLMG